MKTTRFSMFIGMLFISLNFYAGSTNDPFLDKSDPFSDEIAEMLSRSSLFVEEDIHVKVFFTVNEDKVIEIKSISSSNTAVNEYLQVGLNGQQLKGKNWIPNKIYELPVRVRAVR